MEILPGVHWLKAGYANVYLCVEEDGLTLVDSGPPRRAQHILDYAASLGFAPQDVRRILVTHADWDHAGSATEVQARSGATVIASASTAAFLRRGRAPRHMPQPLALALDLLGRYRPVPDDALAPTPPGVTLAICDGLQVIATPGHTPDHHCFYSPARGVLFAGDALSTRGGRLGISSPFITADLEAARRSAQRLLQLAPAVFACGHGDPLQTHDSDMLMELQKKLDVP